MAPKAQVWDDYEVSLFTRFRNRGIDVLVVYFTTSIVVEYLKDKGYTALFEFKEADRWNYYILISSFLFIYYFLMESIFGRTLGKLITGTKVISLKGKPLTFGSILLRTFCRFIPFGALAFLSSWRGLHDRLSKTAVVETKFKPNFAEDNW